MAEAGARGGSRGGWPLAGMLVVAILVALHALTAGSADIGLADLWQILTGSEQGTTARILYEIRLPRVVAAFLTGGMLALAGCLMQVLLRNPLADPYILGVSGGAGVFALLAMLVGAGTLLTTAGAFLGGLLSILLVFLIARQSGGLNPYRTLLTGVVIAAGWGALITLILAVSPAEQLHGMLFWLTGDLSLARMGYGSAWLLVILLGLCLVLALDLNLLAGGRLHAESLGVPVASITILIYLVASLLTALAVTRAGSIGFIGLVVPHLCRLVIGSDHRRLLPLAVLTGGTLLLLADTLARTLLAPAQLPVGALTALIGVPVFLWLLRGSLRGGRS